MARIEKNCKIGEGCFFGKNVTLKRGCVIGNNVTILDNSKIHPNAIIHDDILIDKNCIIENNAEITTSIDNERTIIGAYRKTVLIPISNKYLLGAYDNFYNKRSYWNVYSSNGLEWIASYDSKHIDMIINDFDIRELIENLINNGDIIFYDKNW